MKLLTALLSILSLGLASAAVRAQSSASKEAIKTDQAPLPIGPYSQAIRHGDLVFVSGQLGLNKETKSLEASVKDQTAAALNHVKKILDAAGSGMDCVVKTTVFLADMNDFPAVNEVYASFFDATPPARATIEVAKLPLAALVEIEVIAHVK
jgi:2-iminobutanoate/2-iminopropanoate deaminase